MKPKNPDRLIRICILVTEHQKEFLEGIGKQQGSVYIRKLIDAQILDHDVADDKLRAEIVELESKFNFKKAQLSESESTKKRKQASSQGRKEIIDTIATKLKQYLRRDFRGNWVVTADLQKFIKNNVSDANRVLICPTGSGEPIQEQEVKDRILQIVEVEAVKS